MKILTKPTEPTKLWNKNFIFYVIAFDLAEIGNSLLRFAIPIYILTSTNDPALLGMVLTLTWLPFVIFTTIGGVLADRFNKRHLVIIFNFIIALTIGSFVLLTGHFETLSLSIVILALMTILQSLQASAFETLVYQIIPMKRLIDANSVTWVMMLASGVLAPILAGVMLNQTGIMTIVIVAFLLFILAVVLNTFIKIPPMVKVKNKLPLLKTALLDLKESYQFIWHQQKILKQATIALFFYSLLLIPLLTTIPPVLINNVLQMNETSLGIAQGLIALGGVLGVFILKRFGQKIDIRKLTAMLILSSTILILMIITFMIAEQPILGYWIIILGSLTINTILVMFSLIYFTYLGQNTPREIVGKIMSFAMTVMMLGGTIAQLTIGRLFDIFYGNLALATLVLPVIVLIFSAVSITKAYFRRRTILELDFEE